MSQRGGARVPRGKGTPAAAAAAAAPLGTKNDSPTATPPPYERALHTHTACLVSFPLF